jgi:hypothetical protein
VSRSGQAERFDSSSPSSTHDDKLLSLLTHLKILSPRAVLDAVLAPVTPELGGCIARCIFQLGRDQFTQGAARKEVVLIMMNLE